MGICGSKNVDKKGADALKKPANVPNVKAPNADDAKWAALQNDLGKYDLSEKVQVQNPKSSPINVNDGVVVN